MTPTEFRKLCADDRDMKVGDRVTVRWGYGLSFRAEGQGVITVIYAKSVRVKLSDPVSAPHGGPPWPAGFELKGIPRFSAYNGQWNYWNSVTKETSCAP